MFYGDFGSPPEVDVPDATPEAFKIFLKYIYTDKANLNSSNAYEVHYLAEKYMVEGLRHEAMEVIKKSITSTNVLDFLRDTALVKEIMSHCWDIIDSEAKDVLQSEQFLNVPHSLLLAIISRDRLDVKEITVYERTIEWAKEEAKRSGHDITPQSVRIVLGPAFYEIRD
ncbi:BTB/POZ domain-containing protein 6 [Aphelenchoides avenae]|nr:BTB/POZ domain-containing protein 6 [Aphelenchus avenae]